MLVTRVEIEGVTTSFRYPHFLVGRQPTFEMPPLATLYGHICGAVGEWLDPEPLRIGYRFTYSAKAEDLEHMHLVSRAGGRLPGTDIPKTTEGAVNPVRREFLFEPRLTLYIAPATWTEAFRRPRFTVVLGRSQDLVSYVRVETVKLDRADHAYYEHTVLPWRLRPYILRARAETMPRWIDLANQREPHFARYVVVTQPVFTDEPSHWMRPADSASDAHWVDPDSPERRGHHRGVWLHSLTGNQDD